MSKPIENRERIVMIKTVKMSRNKKESKGNDSKRKGLIGGEGR